MAGARIWRYRDHDNGGKFDGACYVDTHAAPGTVNDLAVQVRCRFRIGADGPVGQTQALWGAADAGGEFSLNLVPSNGANIIQVRLHNCVYDVTEYPLYPDPIYEVRAGRNATPGIDVVVIDQWGNWLYSVEFPLGNPVGSLPATSYYIGAVSSASGAPQRPFHGTVFDFRYHHTNLRCLTFYRNFGGGGDDVVKDRHGHQDGSLSGTVPSSFWPTPMDLSDHIVDIQNIRFDTDAYRTPTFNTFHFDLVDCELPRSNDIIAIRDNAGERWTHFFQVERLETQDLGRTRIWCRDVLEDLDNISCAVFIKPGLQDEYNRTDWWNSVRPCTYTGQPGGQYRDVECFYESATSEHNWASLPYLLRLTISYLQLDRLIRPDVAMLYDLPAPYRHGGVVREFSWFAVNIHCYNQAGSTQRTDVNGASVGDLFREILTVMRLTYAIDDGDLIFLPVAHETVEFDDDRVYDIKESTESQRKHYQVSQERLDQATYWDDQWTGEDVVETVANNLSANFKVVNNVVDLTLTPHFLIRLHNNQNNEMLDISPPLIEQFVDRLDTEFMGDFTYRTVKTKLMLPANLYYIRKTDNLEAMSSEIKVEI
jgi:hypothetical protein